MVTITIERCHFRIDPNNLVTSEMITPIFERLPDAVVDKLNYIVSEIKFLVGGNQWHCGDEGVIKFTHSEYDIKEGRVYIYIHKIFNDSVKSWYAVSHTSFKREIFETFTVLLLYQLQHITRINIDAMHEYSDIRWVNNRFRGGYHNKQVNDLIVNPILSNESVRYIYEDIMGNHETPFNLGFLGILYDKHLNWMKSDMNKLNQLTKIKIINELRRWKMKYKYEVALSEYIRGELYEVVTNLNYILIEYGMDEEEDFDPERNYWNLYSQCKRSILKKLKKNRDYHIYTDSANRKHIFLDFRTAYENEGVLKKLCLEKVEGVYPFFEEVSSFIESFGTCPSCGGENHLTNLIAFYYDERKTEMKEKLLRMKDDPDIDAQVGILCCSCFKKFGFSETNSIDPLSEFGDF